MTEQQPIEITEIWHSEDIQVLVNDYTPVLISNEISLLEYQLDRLAEAEDLNRQYFLMARTSMLARLNKLKIALTIRKQSNVETPARQDYYADNLSCQRMPFLWILKEVEWGSITKHKREELRAILKFLGTRITLWEFECYAQDRVYSFYEPPSPFVEHILTYRGHVLCEWFKGYDGNEMCNRAYDALNSDSTWRIND